MFTFLFKYTCILIFEKLISCVFFDLGNDRILWVLAVFEEIGDYFQTGIWLHLGDFGLFEVAEEYFVCLFVYLFFWALGFGTEVVLENIDQGGFISWHFNRQYQEWMIQITSYI